MSATLQLQRLRRLRRMQLIATGLLLAMVALYAATSLAPGDARWLRYVRAFAEAATVGACADWFAVTALFRRPLGLPIPHTGIIPRNQERIGDALGAFIADSFLTEEILEAKLRRLEVGRWGAAWLRDTDNAAQAAARIVPLVPELLSLSTPEARRRFIGAIATDLISAVPAAPLAAGILRTLSSGKRRDALLDAGLDLIGRALATNHDLIRSEVAGRSYRWLPRWLDQKIADKLLNALAETLEAMRSPAHPWRERIGDYLDGLIERLENDPALAARTDDLKRQITSHPLAIERFGALSDALEARLRPSDGREAEALADWLAGALAGFGAWLYAEAETIEIFNDWARRAVQLSISPRRHEIGRAVASIVADWDTRSVIEKLELQVGADLQYIRVSGTIVGGVVGLLIFTISTWLRPFA